ncbi:hypothetical protein ZOD2009_01855 [Haladaptatus paucihalophilus DX253]|uniref:DUF7967 domain-containing protein n=1 Tax=Haladaptatus paucihalophilus DX253 TaxID=797209 RepID=E7QN53_HALPU|nr:MULTISPECIES: hypothetical protein [Haladaptatus]EFW93848.1 hypothetical protein ZOD2009_01855 [Haladaptatus paucihalophilus DX253]GKZ15173.1 hypothetical protein HAL_30540 [Haladaptatus sp. T7]SHL53073.1 hypothetical protein SAMN05444342_4067 [Haladaptatus paucihalophilus DX253]
MDDVRVWLVERTYSDRDLLTLVYATPDGERYLRKERAGRLGGETTAAIDVDGERLSPVSDEDDQERYAAEATRMKRKRDPNDTV